MTNSNYVREPVTLKDGKKYKLEVKDDNTHQITYEDVSFLSYTSSPEVIIVRINTGQMLRVSRRKVYEIYKNS